MRRWGLLATLLAAQTAGASELPRLAGTLVSPGQRIALFQAGPGHAVAVGIGEDIGDYVVREIGPGQVRLDRAEHDIIVSIEGAVAPAPPVDAGGATFGLVLHHQGPPDD